MSFIDLMQNDIWSNSDIDNKVQALIRSKYSSNDELKASRLARNTNATEADLAFVAEVDTWISESILEGRNAKADMLLLNETLILESAYRRLELPLVEEVLEEDIVINTEEVQLDKDQRQQAQIVVDGASEQATALYLLRNPKVETSVVL